MLDIDKTVRNFLKQAEGFNQLLFVSDSEVEELFGEEVTSSLTKLHHIGQEDHKCFDCGGYCCWNFICDLYDTGLICPIFDYRPLICRFYFCIDFSPPDSDLIMDLANIFHTGFLALSCRDKNKGSEMISPLLAGAPRELTAALLKILRERRNGEINPEIAAELMQREVEEYRTACNNDRNDH